MEDTWHPHPPLVIAHRSQFGMFLKGWELLYGSRLSSISLVRWSPSGDYFLTAKLKQTLGHQNPGLHLMDTCLEQIGTQKVVLHCYPFLTRQHWAQFTSHQSLHLQMPISYRLNFQKFPL